MREDPRQRLSLTKALDHAWLLSYTPVYPSERRPQKEAFGKAQSITRAGVTEDFIGLQLQESALETLNSSASRSVPLQRRSRVLSEAAEAGNCLPEPSWEMIAYATSQEQDKAGESSSSSKGANKRLYAELTPLPEEAFDDAGMDASGSGDDLSTSEKGKLTSSSAVDEDSSSDRPRRSTRRNKVARRD